MKKLVLIAAIALTLTACGGSSHTESPPPAGPAPTPPVSMMDAFFASVQSLVASSPEDTEPVAIDTAAATAPENTEPVQ